MPNRFAWTELKTTNGSRGGRGGRGDHGRSVCQSTWKQIIAVGGNEEAARLSGINIDRVKIRVYAISGLLASLAGFVLIGPVGAAEPIGGTGFETASDRRLEPVWRRGQSFGLPY